MAANDDFLKVRESIAILTDKKLDKNDARAIVTLLGALAGIASAAYLALQTAGVL